MFILCVAGGLAGCRQDMQLQPKYVPLRKSEFFGDNRSARLPVTGTVAQDQLRVDPYFYSGKSGNAEGDHLPFAVTMPLLQRGQQRYNIFCSPCHSRAGDANGMIVQRGYRQPPSFHDNRLRQAPIGHFFVVTTNGYGAMPDYASQIPPFDRWAIAAYIRVLQLSQNGSLNDVPEEMRDKIQAKSTYTPNQMPRTIDGKLITDSPSSANPSELPEKATKR